ncbi:MAG: SpoIIE family protein phosphatase [Gemmatimonadales bacterium]
MAIPIDGGLLVAIVDAVGQGTGAARVAEAAASVVRRSARLAVGEVLTRVHQALAGTAGVSLAVARCRRDAVEFGGIGRVYGAVLGAEGVELLQSEPGTVGIGLPRPPVVFTRGWAARDALVLAADGLVDCWDLAAGRGQGAEPMAALVQRLSGYAARLPEDAAIVVVREGR